MLILARQSCSPPPAALAHPCRPLAAFILPAPGSGLPGAPAIQRLAPFGPSLGGLFVASGSRFMNPSPARGATPAASPVIAPLSSLAGFDPRLVPVPSVCAHLPVVPPEAQTPQALRALFANPPPWEPEAGLERKFIERAPARASVLLAIVLREKSMLIITHPNSHFSTHSGPVPFPPPPAPP